jgi:hypothetical protein
VPERAAKHGATARALGRTTVNGEPCGARTAARRISVWDTSRLAWRRCRRCGTSTARRAIGGGRGLASGGPARSSLSGKRRRGAGTPRRWQAGAPEVTATARVHLLERAGVAAGDVSRSQRRRRVDGGARDRRGSSFSTGRAASTRRLLVGGRRLAGCARRHRVPATRWSRRLRRRRAAPRLTA